MGLFYSEGLKDRLGLMTLHTSILQRTQYLRYENFQMIWVTPVTYLDLSCTGLETVQPLPGILQPLGEKGRFPNWLESGD